MGTGTQSVTGRRKYAGLDSKRLLWVYRTMLLSRRMDEKEIQLHRQGRIYFQISGAGHEALQLAAAAALRPGLDWLFLYYRGRALALGAGVTPFELLLEAVGSAEAPFSCGRQMPSHWGHRRLQVFSRSSPTGTQWLQAVGCAEGGAYYRRFPESRPSEKAAAGNEVVCVTGGDGSTSEGEFFESLNTACAERLPVLYLIEDNGYAISVPVEFQTAGGNISRLVSGYPNLFCREVDGKDFLASYRALEEAVAHCREGSGPALVHGHVVRLHSHSVSDDHKFYKTAEELAEEIRQDPIPKFAEFLEKEGLL
ncbi:MAG: thiamine pyrophosphate-dependent dehydrogenase E1 component subunit alpha, partial [Terriglobia bacterium]